MSIKKEKKFIAGVLPATGRPFIGLYMASSLASSLAKFRRRSSHEPNRI